MKTLVINPAIGQCKELGGRLITDFPKETMSFIGFIVDSVAEKFYNDLKIFEKSKAKIITLRFKSTGGYSSVLSSKIKGVFQSSPVFFEGHNAAFAYSTAAILMQFCHWRSAHPESLMMIHWPITVKKNGRISQNKERQSHWFSVFAARSGKNIDFIQKIAGKKLTAEECFKYNLIDQITKKPLRPQN